jgi:HK97 family phage major capsid protein
MAVLSDALGRDNVSALMPNEISATIIKEVANASACLSLMKKLPNMSKGVYQMPILNVLPTAYFVGETSGIPDLKHATALAWANKYVTAEEVAVIVPIPQAFLDDSEYDVFAEAKPAIEEAFGLLIDQAILFGTSAPTSWPDDILTGATAAGNIVKIGTGDDVYEDLLGEDGLIGKIEAEGFFVNGTIADLSMRAKLRGLRDADGNLIFNTIQDQARYVLDGQSILFPLNGGVDASKALLVTGDWSKAVYSIRQDMTYKVLTEGVIQDTSTKAILYNLAQEDMIALRCVMRLGWQLPNPVNRIQATEALRYPFGVLTP